jgi:hypothetical protein
MEVISLCNNYSVYSGSFWKTFTNSVIIESYLRLDSDNATFKIKLRSMHSYSTPLNEIILSRSVRKVFLLTTRDTLCKVIAMFDLLEEDTTLTGLAGPVIIKSVFPAFGWHILFDEPHLYLANSIFFLLTPA